MNHLRLMFFATAFFIPLASLRAQDLPKSHEECLKVVPGDWGPNFRKEWKQNEAVYWGCRLGVPVETVREWQQFSSGMIQDLIPVKVGEEQIALIESMEGSAHCFSIEALRKTARGWQVIWSPPSSPDSMDYCTLTCPAIRIRADGKNLVLELPEASDPKEDQTLSCKHVKWKKEKYLWDGQTYQPVAVSQSSSPHTPA